MEDIEQLDAMFQNEQQAAVAVDPPRPRDLLAGYTPRTKPGNVIWFFIALLISTVLWSFTWTPVLNFIAIWNDPPEGVDGYSVLAPTTIVYLGACLLLSTIAGAAAFANRFRPTFTWPVLVLAISACFFTATMEMSTGKALLDLLPFPV
jgi:hypothetical protein